MNATPASERVHIGLFGRSNVGKSSLMNALTGQDIAVVAEAKGTTTDPVLKTMEILPLGPVVLLDTPGLDDDTALGDLRIRRARQMLNRADIAVLVLDAPDGITPADSEILALVREKNIPCVVAVNKTDLAPLPPLDTVGDLPVIGVSAKTGKGIHELKEQLAKVMPRADAEKRLLDGVVSQGDTVVLVTPIDASAPKGRLILPQVETLRNLLDVHAIGVVTQVPELQSTLDHLACPPRLVITDSQAFAAVAQIVPPTIPLTSFSILFARYKGFLDGAVNGVKTLDALPPNATILISEGCTHHRQCGDIGTEKLPRLIRRHCGDNVQFEFSSGMGFPDDLSRYALVIHCGGCMLTERDMHVRAKCAADQHVPFTNYGITIAFLTGILPRALEFLEPKG